MFRNIIICLTILVCNVSLADINQIKNHSMDLTSISFTNTSVMFVGSPTSASALNLAMEGRICDGTNSVMFAGGQYTFTSVGETYTYTVNFPSGTFSGNVILSITDNLGSTDCNAGSEGNTTNASIPRIIPMLSINSLIFITFATLLFAMFRMRKIKV